ncbi:hypothetical protein SEVIR_9G051450v4 [Setaria viridis]
MLAPAARPRWRKLTIRAPRESACRARALTRQPGWHVASLSSPRKVKPTAPCAHAGVASRHKRAHGFAGGKGSFYADRRVHRRHRSSLEAGDRGRRRRCHGEALKALSTPRKRHPPRNRGVAALGVRG